VPPPCISAVSEAGATAGNEPDRLGEGDADADGDGEDKGVAEDEGGAEADGDGEALGCADPAEADPVTSCPGAICAEPVITSVREPTGDGASAGTGAACPLMLPGARLARVAEAGT
jgi:hypothetical protein